VRYRAIQPGKLFSSVRAYPQQQINTTTYGYFERKVHVMQCSVTQNEFLNGADAVMKG